MAYFWWILDSIAVLYPLAAFCTQKNGFLGSKGENFEIFKILDPAHFWGSGGLIMLPQGLEDVCEQRGPPDDDFEYWTASVPRRGAEIWAAKVFWRKTKNSRKCIFIIWVQPDVFIFTKMVLRGTNWSHMKTFITVGHFGGIWQEKTHFEPKISQKYNRKRPKPGKPRNWWLSVQPICTQKWWLWEIGWVFWPNCLKMTPELPQNKKKTVVWPSRQSKAQ